MGQCMRDSNRAIARHLHQDVYRDRYRDIWSPNGALTGAYSGTGTRKAARFPEKNPARCETMRSQRSRPGSRSTGNAAGTSGAGQAEHSATFQDPPRPEYAPYQARFLHRPEYMRPTHTAREATSGNNAPETKPFPVEPGRASRRDRLHAAAETAPAGRSHALTPRLNQAISSRHDFLYLRQKRGREIDDMKAILFTFGHLSKSEQTLVS